MKFHQFFLALFLFLSAIANLHASTVRVEDFDALEVTAGNTSFPSQIIYFEKPTSSGLGNEASNPLTIYMPFDSGGGQKNSIFFGDNTKIPTSTFSFISFYLELTNNSTETQFLNIAVKNSSDQYESFILATNESSREISAATTTDLKINFSLQDVCAQNDSFRFCELDSNFTDTIQLYFYLTDSIESDTQVEETDDGFFVDLKISDEIPAGTFNVTSVTRGDNQLSFNVTGGDSITQMGDDFLNVLVFRYSNAVENDDTSFGEMENGEFFKQLILDDDQGSQSEDEFDNGSITVTELDNDESYNLAFAKVNKFLFMSKISNSKIGSPKNIETFLSEQSCFLLSAGFQTNHYVLDYFREFRDDILLKNPWGKALVKLYYDTAPKYAPLIYQSKVISFIVRIFGHILYAVFNYWFLFLGLIVVVLGLFKLKRRLIFS